ncbi:A/G-specific adenine glycosylase [Metasolibacillus sp.]|uniref:A/G-specific adenine glycosylase n=1 Tax=Metasolibacillus sp. TaxID=2703680 RepID=UPI0025DFB85D|nr:A/G-specific adenine glycosylase [Metasolibacillus sp.]MCT6924940.1 A/G-specific adenine glycosylase [Metasolibacillus sp.]MCT6941185.1 A/G-specific adenine glycosylase [Metasolibacillus sp.]
MNYKYTQQFRQALVEWFNREKRDLPWRQTTEPYHIWVSEVMLQQTRVDTVIPYYNRFIERFPTAETLAYAPEQELLKMWEGLGYYSRARNLQAGVREVVETYNSVVPDNRADISKLKGVGPYTAGAILSIAYGKPEHAVDGNVMRVLSRVLHIKEDIALPKTRKVFEEAVDFLIDPENASSFNQGLMELGALICTPTSPKCLLCPVRDYCIAFEAGDAAQLPIKTKKIKMKQLELDVAVIQNTKGHYLLEQRPAEGLLANMWQFPMVERNKESIDEKYNVAIEAKKPLMQFKHVFSHLTWHIDSYSATVKETGILGEHVQWFTKEQIAQLPMPVPMLKIWSQVDV